MKYVFAISTVIVLLIASYIYVQGGEGVTDTNQQTPAGAVQDSRESVDQSQERRDKVQSLGNEALNE